MNDSCVFSSAAIIWCCICTVCAVKAVNTGKIYYWQRVLMMYTIFCQYLLYNLACRKCKTIHLWVKRQRFLRSHLSVGELYWSLEVDLDLVPFFSGKTIRFWHCNLKRVFVEWDYYQITRQI